MWSQQCVNVAHIIRLEGVDDVIPQAQNRTKQGAKDKRTSCYVRAVFSLNVTLQIKYQRVQILFIYLTLSFNRVWQCQKCPGSQTGNSTKSYNRFLETKV